MGLVSANPEENYVQLPLESTQWNDSFTQDDYRALVADLYDGVITVSSDVSKTPGDFAATATVNVYANIK